MTPLVRACALRVNGEVFTGPSHGEIMDDLDARGIVYNSTSEDGFIDQEGVFLTREQAFEVAQRAGQMRSDAAISRAKNSGLAAEDVHLESNDG